MTKTVNPGNIRTKLNFMRWSCVVKGILRFYMLNLGNVDTGKGFVNFWSVNLCSGIISEICKWSPINVIISVCFCKNYWPEHFGKICFIFSSNSQLQLHESFVNPFQRWTSPITRTFSFSYPLKTSENHVFWRLQGV